MDPQFPSKAVEHLARSSCHCQSSAQEVDDNFHWRSCMVGQAQESLGQDVKWYPDEDWPAYASRNELEEVGLLPNGCMLYRKVTVAGSQAYFSDEIGGGVFVWDTALVDEVTLLAAIVEEQRRRTKERHANERKG